MFCRTRCRLGDVEPGGPRYPFGPFALLLLLLTAVGCLFQRPPFDDTYTALTPADLPALPEAAPLRVLVLGDYGTGGDGQREVARAIAATHAEAPPDLVLTVGDNFYPAGVESVYDPLWRRVFENVYSGDFWDRLVFFPALGNHDVDGNERAQVQYSDRNPRWMMPGNYFTFRRALPAGDTARFIALDTNLLKRDGERARLHLEWADSVMASSRDAWIVAYGHHPMVTGGWHGPDQEVRDKLESRLQGRVPLFLSGHNHSTELLRVSDSLLQGVCGGGAGRDNAFWVDFTPETISAFTNGGWCFLHLWPDTMAVELYNRVGTLRFRHVIPRDFNAGRTQ